MALHCGLVGLPNVGKSTLFNCLTKAGADTANFPFCTIDPHVGITNIHDERLQQLAGIVDPEAIIPATIRVVDIAGLVKGASQGQGLGNKFLASIREMNVIIQVVRCFEDSEIVHVDGKVDPISDIETIDTELMLADLEVLDRARNKLMRSARAGIKEAKSELVEIEQLIETLNQGTSIREVEKVASLEACNRLQLLSAKPCFYVANVDEEGLSTDNNFFSELVAKVGRENVVKVCAKLEMEASELEVDDQKELLKEWNVESTGLENIGRTGYKLLELLTFFTAGKKEVRAWSIKKGESARDAAKAIHTDFYDGFIRADTISYEAFIAHKGEEGAKNSGKLRSEGREYVVEEGDVLHFRVR